MQGLNMTWIFILMTLIAAFGSCSKTCSDQKPCARRCPYRYLHDENGCNTCKCCPVLRCPFCWSGYIIAKAPNQCLSCHCKIGL